MPIGLVTKLYFAASFNKQWLFLSNGIGTQLHWEGRTKDEEGRNQGEISLLSSPFTNNLSHARDRFFRFKTFDCKQKYLTLCNGVR